MSLSRHLWIMLLAILLPIAMSLLYLLYNDSQAQKAHLQLQLDSLAGQQRQLLESRLESGQQLAASFAFSPWAQQLDPRQCPPAFLRQALAGMPGYSNIVTLNRRGDVICSAIRLDRQSRARVSRLPQLAAMLGVPSMHISEPMFAPLSQRWVSVVSHPLRNARGELTGQILLPLDLQQLRRASIAADLPPGTDWQVVSGQGKLIQASDSRLQPGLDWHRTANDGPRLERRYALPRSDWQLRVSVPAAARQNALINKSLPLLLAMLLALSLATLAGWRFTRSLLRPLQQLTALVLRVGRGESNLRAAGDGPREVMLLGQEINRMLDAMAFSESRYHLLFGASTDGVIIVDKYLQIIAINAQGARMFGYGVDELIGQSVNILLPPEMRHAHQHTAGNYAEDPTPRTMGHRPTLKGLRKDGATVLVQITLSPLPPGSNGSTAAIVKDVSEQHQLQEKLQWLSQYDSLSNLPNRMLLNDRLNQSLLRAGQQQQALIVIGLDQFKAINDEYGYDFGDRVLALFAQRLSAAMGSERTVARIGGDEFAVLVEDSAAVHQLQGVLEKLRQLLQVPLDGTGQEKLQLGGSVGVALYPDDAGNGSALLKAAEVALTQAKQHYRGGLCFFSEKQMPHYRKERNTEVQLRAAIAANELLPFFQPIVALDSMRIAGVEALVRWPRGTDMVSPATFLPLAEAAGLLPALEQQTRRKAMAAVRHWQDAGQPLWLTINVSPGEFDTPHFAGNLSALVSEAGLTPTQIILEITESAVLGDQASALARMQQLQDMGYRIAIDDFGTGYSSLSYLHSFPFDRLKLDRSFVARLLSDDKARKVTAAIIAMAHELGLLVIAEGVEEAGQLNMLRDMGCDYVQGFHLYRPLPDDELSRVLAALPPAAS